MMKRLSAGQIIARVCIVVIPVVGGFIWALS